MPSIETRHDYEQSHLDESDVDPDPIRQFHSWFGEAEAANIPEPNAMIVSTCTPEGRPSSRVVLMRGFDDRGFTFFTNYRSRKGREIEANPFVAALFFWQSLERQVRIEGSIHRVPEAESDAYFAGRPPKSKRGAWVSDQSAVVADRSVLEVEMEQIQARFPGDEVPRPPHWGGFRIVPEVVEFWQGRRSRLHDRLAYRRSSSGAWTIERLSP